MTRTTLSAKLTKFWNELPTRIFLFFMSSDDPTYGNGAWYKQLGGPRELTPHEIEDAKFSPDNYRSGSHNDAVDISRGYDKLLAIRDIPLPTPN